MYILSLVLFLALSAAPQDTKGSLEGKVLRTGTTDPIERAEVRLTREGMEPVYKLTDEKGLFAFSNLESGTYEIRIQRDGYFGPSSSTSASRLFNEVAFSTGIVIADQTATSPLTARITLAAGQHRADPVYYLTPGGLVTGRIFDRTAAVAGATVSAMRLDYREGQPRLTAIKTATADDRGEFRISWLEAGEYFIRADATLADGAARSYFPGTDNASKALKVRVTEGTETPGINIPMASSVSVKVSGIAANTVSATRMVSFFTLYPVDQDHILDGPLEVENAVTDSEDRYAGKFEIRGVRPGTYDLVARLREPGQAGTIYRGPIYVGRTRIVAGSEDLDGVKISFTPLRDLRVSLVYDSNLTPSAAITPRVQLFSPATATTDNSARVSSDGALMISNLQELPYSVSVTGLPPDAYVADIRHGRRTVFDTGTITIGSETGQNLEIVLSAPAATIRGSVSSSPPQPLIPGTSVVLVPVDRPENTRLFKRANVSSTGTFSIAGVVPGRYRIFAFESIPATAELNATFMQTFRDNAREITVGRGETSTVELNLIRQR
jgi:hypothetical protein